MDQLPDRPHPDPEVLEATEIIGPDGTVEPGPGRSASRAEPRGRGWLDRLAARAAAALLLLIAGLALAILGALLTVSIVGAPLGIPLGLLGLGLILASIFVGLGGGRFQAVTFRRSRR